MQPASNAALTEEQKAAHALLTGFVEKLNVATDLVNKIHGSEANEAIATSLLVIAKMMVWGKADELNLLGRLPALK